MHPLLSPTTHADLEILARELTLSGYYPEHDAYLKLFFGVTLGLSALESLKGITLEGESVIIEYHGLIERAVKRAGYTVQVVVTDALCIASVLQNGRLVGKLESPSDKNAAGRSFRIAYAAACREYLPDVFGHKFLTRDEVGSVPTKAAEVAKSLTSQTGIAVTTADKAPAPKPKPKVVPTDSEEFISNLSVSNRNALLSWQNEVDALDTENPKVWDAHRFKLGKLNFLSDDELIELFERFAAHALSLGLGYNPTERRFYVIQDDTVYTDDMPQ